MKWTPKDEALLERLRENGTAPTVIAERLGRSTSAICQHAIRRLGLETLRAPKKFWSQVDAAQLRKLFPTHTIRDIASELERTVQSTRDKSKTMGLYRRNYPL